MPIHNANVEAFVYQDGVPNGRPLKLKLEDTGKGYPDITMGDGIYSAYLTQSPGSRLQKSYYLSVVLKTDYNNGKAYLPKPYGNEKMRKTFDCCGSKLPDYYTIPTSPFERVLSGQSFMSKPAKINGKKDQFPPSRITDLKLKNYVNHTLQATLEWTSPGKYLLIYLEGVPKKS